MRKRLSLAGVLGVAVLGLSALGQPALASPTPDTTASTATASRGDQPKLTDLIPAPVQAKPNPREDFRLMPWTVIRVQPNSAEARRTGDYLAGLLRRSTGYPLPVIAAGTLPLPSIALTLGHADKRVGDQGYQLDVNRTGVSVRANTGDGLFAGVQSLRQLLPAAAEAKTVQFRSWTVSGGSVLDYPRFAQRGAMLDVARHFFTPDKVKTYIDQLAQYKINQLHLHLADDQGWRIEIKKWPRLTSYGSTTQVGGGKGGFYTQEQYKDLVAYAASRHMTVVPEIDMPGHTNAALASYAELNCDGVAPPLYTGIEVGFSSFCVDKDITYKFLDDVLGELAAITPGKYLHVGGDEAKATTPADYATFMGKVLPLVAKHGKSAIGWDEIAQAKPPVDTIPQFWDTDGEDADVAAAAAKGNKILLSPANKAYVDQQYDKNSRLGLHWAGYVEVKDSYDWDPATAIKGVGEESVAGVEAPLWAETIQTNDDIEYLAFPRVAGIAEIGWSPRATHSWDAYRLRLAQQAPRWERQGIDFYRSPQVDWK